MDEVLEDWRTARIPARTRAALRLLECMTLRPLELDAAFVATLRNDGLDDASIRAAANVGFHFNLINRIADAFDFESPSAKGRARLAAMLNLGAKLLRGSEDPKIEVRGADGAIRPPEVERGRTHLLTCPGETAPELRRAVEAFVCRQWGHARGETAELPEELERYCTKLARGAYKIIDEDIDELRAAGYSDDALYELTLVGATAAALVGLERLYAALYER